MSVTISLKRSSLVLAVVLAATTANAGEPMTENSHPLELVLLPTEGPFGPQVEASVHNPASRRVFLQVTTPEVFAISAELTADGGERVDGMHTWATRGRPMMGHTFYEIPAGESLAIDSFQIHEAESRAAGGGWNWDLREQRGKSVYLTFSFTQDCDGRTTELPNTPLRQTTAPRPKKLGAIFCGTLVSAPMEIAIPPWDRENVLATLQREPVVANDAYDVLTTDALAHESESVRQNAAFSLGELGRPEAAVHLAPLLLDPNREVRGYAARSLGTLKNPDVLPALEAALPREQDDWVRDAIARAIHATER